MLFFKQFTFDTTIDFNDLSLASKTKLLHVDSLLLTKANKLSITSDGF